MDLDALRTLITLSELKNFTKTAGQQHIVQSTVTSRIKMLEKELGQELFRRTRQHVELTDAGRLLLPYARSLLDLEQSAKDDLKNLGTFPYLLRVASVYTIYDCFMEPWIKRYRELRPDVALKLFLGDSSQVMRQFHEKTADICYTYAPFSNSRVECIPFRKDDLILVASPQLNSYPQGISQSQISRLPLLFTGFLADSAPDWFNSLFPECCGFPLSCNVGGKLLPFLVDGLGYAFLPRAVVQAELTAGLLMEIPLLDSTLPQLINYILVRKKSREADAVACWLAMAPDFQ